MRPNKRMSRTPSFVMVGTHEEEDEINCFMLITNMGMPILYAFSVALMIIGVACMAVITGYWGHMDPPQCFLYSQTPYSSGTFYQFGSDMSSCNWVAYGPIPAIILCILCALAYTFHMRDDKQIDGLSLAVLFGILITTLLMLAVVSSLTQGLRITCSSVSMTTINNRGSSCKDKIDRRDDPYNFPVDTSVMINSAMATYWIATIFLILISIFHVILVVRRKARN